MKILSASFGPREKCLVLGTSRGVLMVYWAGRDRYRSVHDRARKVLRLRIWRLHVIGSYWRFEVHGPYPWNEETP
jgi:hypothetical protein